MTRKYWTYGLLTAVILIGGCADSMSNTKNERNAVNSDSNIVTLETSMGDIVIELDRQAAPVTTANFLEYASEGFYDGTIFHRVMRGFMIQGGGFTKKMEKKKTHDPIVNEAKNGLSNTRGTIAMARMPDPNSATCQFFINHQDNTPLDTVGGGYAVFGKVKEGMDVVDAIAAVKTTRRKNKDGDTMDDVPVEPVIIKSATIVPK
jgi:peptidyl-prolyl cis-trans isomerase A (cyclophilin A)